MYLSSVESDYQELEDWILEVFMATNRASQVLGRKGTLWLTLRALQATYLTERERIHLLLAICASGVGYQLFGPGDQIVRDSAR